MSMFKSYYTWSSLLAGGRYYIYKYGDLSLIKHRFTVDSTIACNTTQCFPITKKGTSFLRSLT